MIFLFALLLADPVEPTPAPPPSAIEEHDIVVVARRFRGFRGTAHLNDGVWSCTVEHSSGYPDFDTLACAATTASAVETFPAYMTPEKLAWAKLSEANALQLRSEAAAAFGACGERRKRAIYRQFAAERRRHR